MTTSEHFLLGALLAAIASFAYCVPVSYEMYSQYEPNDILTYSYHDDKVYSDEKDLSGYNMEDDYQYTTDIISEEEHVSNGLHPDHTEASSGTDSKTAEQSTDTMSSTFNASSNELYFETFTRNSTRFRSETTVVHQSATTALHSDMPNLMTPTSEIFGVNKTIMNAKFSSKSVQDDAKKALKLFCSFSEVRTMLQFKNKSDCLNIREYNTSYLNQSLPVTTFTSTNETDLQKIYKSIIIYRKAIHKISLLQGLLLCIKVNLTHCECDQSMIDNIFCPSAKKEIVGHICETQNSLKGIAFENLEFQHTELMYELRMKPSDDSTDINPPQCTAKGCDKVQIAKYTWVGIVQTIQQAEQIQKMYDALCQEQCMEN